MRPNIKKLMQRIARGEPLPVAFAKQLELEKRDEAERLRRAQLKRPIRDDDNADE